MEQSALPYKLDGQQLCRQCFQLIETDVRFCNYCGSRQTIADERAAEVAEKKWIVPVSVFAGIIFILTIISNLVGDKASFGRMLFFDVVLSLLTVSFFIYYRHDLASLFKWRSFSVIKLFVYLLLSVAASILVNVAVSWFNKSVFSADNNFYTFFTTFSWPKTMTVLFVALQPAVIEEMAYRGIVQQGFSKIMDEKQTIFITSFFFALAHISIVSFLWIFPFAIILGYIRHRENTLWYGIFIHFAFNATACVIDFIKSGAL